jgi:hypothetical protein
MARRNSAEIVCLKQLQDAAEMKRFVAAHIANCILYPLLNPEQ